MIRSRGLEKVLCGAENGFPPLVVVPEKNVRIFDQFKRYCKPRQYPYPTSRSGNLSTYADLVASWPQIRLCRTLLCFLDIMCF